MAIYNAGYLSPIRKKLGNAVGRKWRNLNVLAVYQPNVRNPRSEVQQANRLRFRTLSQISMMAQYPIMLGLKAITDGTRVPPRSMFMHLNWDIVHVDSPGTATVDLEEMKFSYGGLDQVQFGALSVADPLNVKLTLVPSTDETPTTSPRDQVYLVVRNRTSGAFVVATPVDRSDDSIDVDVPPSWVGVRVDCYVFAIGHGVDDDGKVSMTGYAGSATIS